MTLHLDALILLHRVWGAFGILTGTALAVLAGGTDVAELQAGSLGRAELAAVWVLTATAAAILLAALAALAVARGLRRRLPAGRAGALVLAVPNLVIVPFGTALGIYTFWVLLNDDARREFGRPPRGAASSVAPAR
jgi:hypothetical protein